MKNQVWVTGVKFSEFSMAEVVEKLKHESEAAQRVAHDVLGAAGSVCQEDIPRLFPDASRAYDGHPRPEGAAPAKPPL